MSAPSSTTRFASLNRVNTILSKAEGAAAGGAIVSFVALVSIMVNTSLSPLVPVVSTIIGAAAGWAWRTRTLRKAKDLFLSSTASHDEPGDHPVSLGHG